MFTGLIFVAVLATFADTSNAAPCDGFALAKYYTSHMVLQGSPVRSRIWGYADSVGDEVVVEIADVETVRATAVLGDAGRPKWEAVFQPITEPGPYTITVTQVTDNCRVVLDDVLVGDVWICSGQSNMQHSVEQLDNPDSVIDDAVNYPYVRTLYNNYVWSDVPLEDLQSIVRPWQLPTGANIRGFSALCWLYGVNLWRKLQRPIGMIESNWGGTRVEAWSSPEALEVCFGSNGPPVWDAPNGASQLWNSMIHPFLPMPIYGAIWYQGESNTYNANLYNCALKAMVSDWRSRWHQNSPDMDSVFPFGEVQLAPWRNQDIIFGFPDIRWSQTSGFGYTPNDDFDRIFMAVAVDLPDYDSPYGDIHPRYKRQIADRLALSGFAVAYGHTDVGIHQGPIASRYTVEAPTVRLDYPVAIEIRAYQVWSGFELCCSPLAADPSCSGQSAWIVTDLAGWGNTYVDLNNVCTDSGRPNAVGYRYLWRESPCAFEACAVYSVENSLPAPPYVAFF